jgi:CRP-like cAMP-binding protein
MGRKRMAQPESAHPRPRNHLLSTLSSADFELLRSDLEPIELPVRFSAEESNLPIKHIYFPDAGIISVVAIGPRNRQVEVALIGPEGMTGLPVVMADDRSPHKTYVQVAGSGTRIPAGYLRRMVRDSTSLQACFLRFARAYYIQTAHSAVASAQGTIPAQLARWLLMAHDRLESDELPLTHEFLSLMLGVRRAGVTTALQGLVRRHFIRTARKSINVVDRDGLVKFANGLYGVPEAEYRRLTGWHTDHRSKKAAARKS